MSISLAGSEPKMTQEHLEELLSEGARKLCEGDENRNGESWQLHQERRTDAGTAGDRTQWPHPEREMVTGLGPKGAAARGFATQLGRS